MKAFDGTIWRIKCINGAICYLLKAGVAILIVLISIWAISTCYRIIVYVTICYIILRLNACAIGKRWKSLITRFTYILNLYKTTHNLRIALIILEVIVIIAFCANTINIVLTIRSILNAGHHWSTNMVSIHTCFTYHWLLRANICLQAILNGLIATQFIWR